MCIPPYRLCTSPLHKGPRWLHACYFYSYPDRDGTRKLRSHCITCFIAEAKPRNMLPDRRAKRQEYDREYRAARRRAKGVEVRKLKNPTPIYGEGRTILLSKPERVNGYKLWQFLRTREFTLSDSEARYLRRKKNEQVPITRAEKLLITAGYILEDFLIYQR